MERFRQRGGTEGAMISPRTAGGAKHYPARRRARLPTFVAF